MKQDEKQYSKQMAKIGAYSKIYHYFAKNAAVLDQNYELKVSSLEYLNLMLSELDSSIKKSRADLQF